MAGNSQGFSAAQITDMLNRCMPAAAKAQLGQLLSDLITAANAAVAALSNACLGKAGLAIHGAASPTVKSTAAIAAVVNGVLVGFAPADLSALAGTLATAKSAAWAFYIDGTGAITTSAKTADSASHAAAMALVPAPPANKAQIGVVVIDNATGSNFVGGTTALDTGSLTVTYYDTMGPVAIAAATVGALGSR